MSKKPDIWRCPRCSAELDIAELGFYANVECPACGHSEYVHTLLANFRIEGLLGIGGMSVVLRGRDVVLNRPVAIKVLNETYRNQPERIARFENECSLMAKVRHDNVVSVYSAGWARGQFYIAMELVSGKNLETVVTPENPLKPLRALEVTTQIVKGLEAAHNAGLLHRDMKPGNVIISSQGQAKVLDFGLAQGRAQEDSEEVIWATPFYVPPETLQRNQEDARTDMYALGMTLRYLLTGEETLPGAPSSVTALLNAKSQLSPFADIMPRAPECLCELVDRMTSFEPADRHDNYADLLAELKEVSDTIRAAQDESLSPRLRSKRFRNRLAFVAGCVALGVVAFFTCRMLGAPSPQRELIRDKAGSSKNFYFQGEQDLSGALSFIRKGDVASALKCYSRVNSDAVEPTISAWGALHATCLAYLNKRGEEADTHYSSFLAALERPCAGVAGQEMMEQLRLVPEAMDKPDAMGKIRDPRILALAHCLRVRHMFELGRTDEAMKSINKAREAFLNCKEKVYKEQMAEYTQNLDEAFSHIFTLDAKSKALTLMREHEFSQAEGCLSAMLNESSEDSAEIAVMVEVCEIAKEMKAALIKKLGDQKEPGMSGDAFLEKVKVNKCLDSERAEEICALLYMVQADYRVAFEKNPYRDAPDSTAPFAVVMRDWKIRLGM